MNHWQQVTPADEGMRAGRREAAGLPTGDEDSVLSIRLYNAQQVAADLAKRLNDLHREACVDEPLAAMVILPLIGDANRIGNVLAQLVEVRK